jgi:uncharacterized protein with HEPN domain
MMDYAREAIALVSGKSREDISSDRTLGLALVRLLEIVGEAASRTSDDTRCRHPEIPWAQIVSLRNRLIHGYDSVDMDILCEILTADLPSLIEALAEVLGES